MKYKAVIFDLFGTLVDNFSFQDHQQMLSEMADVLKVSSDDFVRLWIETFNNRITGKFQTPESNIEYICRQLGVIPEAQYIKSAAKIRRDFTRSMLKPRNDACEVLSNLKSKGLKIGLITDCSSEVPIIWEDTPFASLIDEPVFSCLTGMKKPDPQIYQMACKRLGVDPQYCLYIGDGSNRELTGASKVGMHPVLIRVPYEDDNYAFRINPEEWDGNKVSALKDILDFLV
ncbi:MAG: HAD family hydrolase [Methanomassiliicoccales archaeon]|nr:MAG: HAD family hydrolase [Methanomassiliicoccales archaeon]